MSDPSEPTASEPTISKPKTTEIIPQRPYAQCYICHAPNVTKVCHHCGRAICDKPTCKSTLLPGESLIPNEEFRDMALDNLVNPHHPAIHCKFCVEKYHGKWLIQRALRVLFRRHRAPLQTIPTINSVSMTEQMEDKVILDVDGNYVAPEVKTREGELKFSFQFSERDRERLDAYRKRFWLQADTHVRFHAGFAVLEGTNRLQPELLDPTTGAPLINLTKGAVDTIAFTGNSKDQLFLKDRTSHANSWEVAFKYSIVGAEGKPIALPVHIIPTVVPDNTMRVLHLLIQLRPEAEYEGARVEEMTLWAPKGLGHILKTEPSIPINYPLNNAATATELTAAWKSLNIDKDKERQCHFFIHFQNSLEPTMTLRGKLKLNFKGAFSGLKDVKFFYPWGRKREGLSVKRQTNVTIDFEINLHKLCFQTEYTLVEHPPVPSIPLDHLLITTLTESLTKADLYVRQVVEHPARVAKTGGQTTKHYWDITGRAYIGVYPIDFHLALASAEHNEWSNKTRTTVDLKIQGVVAKPEMQAAIEQCRTQLLEQVDRTFKALASQPNQQHGRAPMNGFLGG